MLFAVPAIPPEGERMGQQTVGCVVPDELGLGKLPAVTSVPRWLERLAAVPGEWSVLRHRSGTGGIRPMK